MENDDKKVVEKYYIESSESGFKRFALGFMGGLGWGVGLTLGTSVLLLLIGFIISKINWIPVFGQFLADIIKASEKSLNAPH